VPKWCGCLQNIPEGIIVAAPIFAATGSRTRALTIATLSGLSEPLGALLALVFVRPFLTPLRLHCLLAFTGAWRKLSVPSPADCATIAHWDATLVQQDDCVRELWQVAIGSPHVSTSCVPRAVLYAGGIMLAVCAMELFPEARKCKRDLRAFQGIAIGAILMGATLSADV
jgi:zinc transporter ZupT